MTDQEPAWRNFANGVTGIERQDVVPQRLDVGEGVGLKDYTRVLHGPVKDGGVLHPLRQVGRGGEGRHATHPLVGRGAIERQHTAESETRQRQRTIIFIDVVRDGGQVGAPLLWGERARARPHARKCAGDHKPAQLGSQVLRQFGQQSGRLAAHAGSARQTVHQNERVRRRAPPRRASDANVDERRAAGDLCVVEHESEAPA